MALIRVKNHPRDGITLIELLIGITISGFMVAAMMSVYFAHYKIYIDQTAIIETETQNKLGMTEMLKYLRQAVLFEDGGYSTSSYNASDVTDCQATTPAGGTETYGLEFGIPPIDSNGKSYFIDFGQLDTIRFYRNPSNPGRYTKLLMDISPTSGSTRTSIIGKVIAIDICKFRIAYNNATLSDATSATISLTTKTLTVYGKKFTSAQTASAYIK